MSDIRYNQWLHNSGTGGVSQDAGGNIGIGTTAPLIPVGAGNTAILNVGVVTCNSIEVTGNVSVGGTLTYQDVTNIDSVGVITARSDIRGSRNLKIAGISTFNDNVTIVKSSGPLLELTTNTGANDATLRLSEGATGSTTNGGGMFYSGADNKLHITCGTNSTTKRITIKRDEGYVGVGEDTPATILHVKGNVGDMLRLDRNNAGAVGNQIAFRHSASGTLTETGSINCVSTANAATGELRFYTKASSASNLEKLRIESDGDVCIGRNSGLSDAKVSIQCDAAEAAVAVQLNASGGTSNLIQAYSSAGPNVASICVSPDSTPDLLFKLHDGSNTVQRLLIDSSGNITNTGIATSYVTTSFSANFAKIDLRGTNIANSNHYILSYGEGHANDHEFHMVNTVGHLVFRTGASGQTQRVRINSLGEMSIGGQHASYAYDPNSYGNPSLLIAGDDNADILTLMNDDPSPNNNDYATLGFRVAGQSTGSYSKAAIIAERMGGYNALDLVFAIGTDADNTRTTTSHQRLRIKSNGAILSIPRKSYIDGAYVYRQRNQSQNYEHRIRGPLGGFIELENYDNITAEITVNTIGTGTNPCFCKYRFDKSDGTPGNGTLTHIAGGSSGNSNVPYMVISSNEPRWKMNHSSNYYVVVRVVITGGDNGETYTSTGEYFAN